MQSPWDVDGYFVGTVQGVPVNCRYQFRTRHGLTEVLIHEEGDTQRQSTVSRNPLIAEMALHVIQEFHCARSRALDVSDPVPPTIPTCQITLLHDYLHADRAG